MTKSKTSSLPWTVMLIFVLIFCVECFGQNVSDLDSERKAAEQGDASAQYNLGVMYRDGNGVPKDLAKAVEWFRKAAEQGYPNAQYNLGVMYQDGDGVPRDLVQAHKWFSLAAASGSEGAPDARPELESVMTKEQIAEAEKLASEWREAHPEVKK